MDNEVELISDGDGLAVIGNPPAVERFIASVGLSSNARSPRLGAAFAAGASVAQTGSEIAANSGRWVKLTEESARAVKQFGLMETKTPGVSHAMVGQPGDITRWIQIVKSPGSIVTNPAMLAGAAGIDEKLDDVLRAQTNQVLARMDGVALAVKEARSVRETVGRVSEVTWSKVQHQSATILETQGYALRQLGDLADKIDKKAKVGDLAKTAKEAEAEVEKWLAVLARCFQLHDAIGVLELDRVQDASPDELDRHRLGLKAARRDRLGLISERTEHLLARMNAAAGTANSKVLLHPTSSPAVVESSNHVAADVHDFHRLLGIESGRESSEARRWRKAAAEQWGRVRASGGQGIDNVKRLGSETRGQARSVRDKLSEKIAERRLRRREDDEEHDE
jgi:hypothetical protein